MTPPFCSVTSAIRGLPTTMVETRVGNLTSLAWSTLTAMAPATGSACAASGHDSAPIPITNRARARLRREHNNITYPGTLTSRQMRYAAEPAPDAGECDVNV